jgi:hypothetical protein
VETKRLTLLVDALNNAEFKAFCTVVSRSGGLNDAPGRVVHLAATLDLALRDLLELERGGERDYIAPVVDSGLSSVAEGAHYFSAGSKVPFGVSGKHAPKGIAC